jgi:methyl-accepting chemotaxis protein
MNRRTHRRKLRNLWIRKDIQLWLAILNALFMIVVISAVILSVLAPLYQSFQLSDDYRAQHFAAKLFILILDRLLPTLVAIVALGTVYTIVITHRICGPLVNLSKTFERISAGDFTRRVNLRRSDFLKPEAAMVNRMNDALSMRFNTLVHHHQAVKIEIEKLAILGNRDAAIEKAVTELSQSMEACRQALDQIKTNLHPEAAPAAAFSTRHTRAPDARSRAEG